MPEPTVIYLGRIDFPKGQFIKATVGQIKYTCNCPDYLKAVLKSDGTVAYSWGNPDNECWHIAAVRYHKGEDLPLAADIPVGEDEFKLQSKDPLSRWANRVRWSD